LKTVNVSLLWPEGKTPHECSVTPLSPTVAADLNIDSLCKNLCKDDEGCQFIKQTLMNLCHDETVIKYRQDIFYDFLSLEPLVTRFVGF